MVFFFNKTGPNSGVSQKGIVPEGIEVNNFGPNVGLQVVKDRQRNASKNELKWVVRNVPTKINSLHFRYILFWNEAYGSKEYDLGFGREPFYTARCPETRCFTTANRNLKKHEDFDAIFFHQRSLDWKDIPDRLGPFFLQVTGKKIAENLRLFFSGIICVLV